MTAPELILVTSISFGVNGLIVGPAVPLGMNWAQDTFVTVASENLKLLYAVEDEMAAIQRRIDNGTASQGDLQRMATLKERKRHLSQ